MSFENDEKEFLFQYVPRINDTLKNLYENGLKQDDVIAILHNRMNKGTLQCNKISKSKVEQVLREVKKLDLDVRGQIE